jgi:hypothetical protein
MQFSAFLSTWWVAIYRDVRDTVTNLTLLAQYAPKINQHIGLLKARKEDISSNFS